MKDITKLITAVEAAVVAHVNRATIVNWCRVRNIGIKVGGRWKVDPTRLDKVLSGYTGYFTEDQDGKKKKARSKEQK